VPERTTTIPGWSPFPECLNLQVALLSLEQMSMIAFACFPACQADLFLSSANQIAKGHHKPGKGCSGQGSEEFDEPKANLLPESSEGKTTLSKKEGYEDVG
jgi:hypothetical protein